MEPGISTSFLHWCLSTTYQEDVRARHQDTGSSSQQGTLLARGQHSVVSGKWAELACLCGLGIVELTEMWGQRHTQIRQKTERGKWGKRGREGGSSEEKERRQRMRDRQRQREKKEEGVGTKGRRGSNGETERRREIPERGGGGVRDPSQVSVCPRVLVRLWDNKKVKPRVEFLVKTSKVLNGNIGNGPAHIVC